MQLNRIACERFLVREETFKWLTVRTPLVEFARQILWLFYRWNNVLSDFLHTSTAHVLRDIRRGVTYDERPKKIDARSVPLADMNIKLKKMQR